MRKLMLAAIVAALGMASQPIEARDRGFGFPTGLPARLIEPWNWLIRLKVRLVGVPPWVVPKCVSPWAMR
jgi:hypothetical protein